MAYETRTRICMFLPIPKTLPQFYAVLDVLDGLEHVCDGLMRTDYYAPQIWGQWFDQAQAKRIEDDLVFIIADHPSLITNPKVAAHLEQMKLYAQFALGQDIVWITTHEVIRISTHDYVR